MPLADENHRAPLLWVLAPYIGGLVIGACGAGVAQPLVVVLAAFLGFAALAVSQPRLPERLQVAWAPLIALAATLGGIVHMQHALDPAGAAARWEGMPEREARLHVEVTRLFATAEDDPRQLCLGRIVHAPAPLEDLLGQRVCFNLYADSSPETARVRTARVELQGILRRLDPRTVEPGGFEEFLVRSGVGFVYERARFISVVREPTAIALFLHRASQRFETILRHGLPPDHPATSVYVAMFLGRKSELSDAQKESYLRSGTMHLFAISGLHIAIIAYCLKDVLTVLRLRPGASTVLGLAALWVFVEATGGTPSARRAFLMVAFVWAGGSLRRPANPLASLVASALLVLVADPLALLSASFQLSYAVVAALLLYGLPLRTRWHAWWTRLTGWGELPPAALRGWQRLVDGTTRSVLTGAAISFAATLVSTPLSLDYFGLASPGAVLSNLVLMPISMGAIAAAFASLACGLPGAMPLSIVFNHAGALILVIVDFGAHACSLLPGMFFRGGFAAAWMAPAVVLTLLALLVAGYSWGWTRFPGRCWTPVIVAVALLVFLVTPESDPQQSTPMKSAYELAMERLRQSDPGSGPELTVEQKEKLAEIDRVYRGRLAEREIFLQRRLADAEAAGQADELDRIRQEIASERARLEEECEAEKDKIRHAAGGAS